MKTRNLFLVLALVAFTFVLVACGKTYNVNFETNGGSTAESVAVKKASEVSLPAITKEGYELAGWFTDAAFTKEFKVDMELSGDITLYAKWDQLVYKVKFVVNDKVVKEQDVAYGSAATAPENPEVDGYTFVKWDADYSSVKKDIEVKAEFKLKEYIVQFMDGSTELSTNIVKHGNNAVAPSETDKTGYTFKGWDKDITNVTDNLVVNAIYEANEYNITYYDGTNVINLAPAKFTYGTTNDLPEYEKAGTIFEGWYDSSDFSHKVISLSKLTNDVTLYAKYYTIKYYDGTTEITNLPSAKIEDGVLQVPAYNVDGFAFVGWYTDENYTSPLFVEDEVKSDLNLRALLVKIDFNGGATSWVTSDWGANQFKNGIDAISTLPEEFEKDLFQYLSDNDLLNSEKVGATMKATTWQAFSAVNPNHSGDPKRVWNDSTANKSNDSSDGYLALFFYESLEYDEETGKLTDIIGGFLGTEPYKTRYFNVMQHLVLMYNGKYRPKNYSVPQFGDSNSARQLYAFLLDGWFYGTQGLQNDNSVFDAARKVVPTTTTGYTWDGTKLVAYENKYEVTSEIYSMDTAFAIPFGTTKFLGWYLEKEGNTKLTDNNITNRMTIYAKWE